MFDGSYAGPGRPKDSKNKRRLTANALLEMIEKKNFDPVFAQIDLYRDPNTPAMVKFKINETFLRLLYPATKAVEHSGSVESRSLNISMNISDQQSTQAALDHAQTVNITVEPTVDATVEVDTHDDG